MLRIVLFLFLLASGNALAGSDLPDQLGELKAQLDEVRQEQQSVYQDYAMTKELRRLAIEASSPFMLLHPYGISMEVPPSNFEDMLRKQQLREKQIQQYTSELKELSAHYLQLDGQRKSLIKQIRELKQGADE